MGKKGKPEKNGGSGRVDKKQERATRAGHKKERAKAKYRLSVNEEAQFAIQLKGGGLRWKEIKGNLPPVGAFPLCFSALHLLWEAMAIACFAPSQTSFGVSKSGSQRPLPLMSLEGLTSRAGEASGLRYDGGFSPFLRPAAIKPAPVTDHRRPSSRTIARSPCLDPDPNPCALSSGRERALPVVHRRG
jgi:hypothetical protein